MKTRTWKRMTAAVTAAALLGIAAPVLAEEPAPAAQDSGLVKEMVLDFNSLPTASGSDAEQKKADSAATEKALQATKTFDNITTRAASEDTEGTNNAGSSNHERIIGEKKTYGKDPDDTVLKLYNEAGMNLKDDLQRVFLSGIPKAADNSPVYSTQDGQYYEFSMDLCLGDNTGNFELRAYGIDNAENGATSGDCAYLMSVSGTTLKSDLIKFDGVGLAAHRWYNVKFLFKTGKAGSIECTLYLNGKVFSSGKVDPKRRNTGGDYTAFYGLRDIWLTLMATKGANGSNAAQVYYDNVRAAVYSQLPDQVYQAHMTFNSFDASPDPLVNDQSNISGKLGENMGFWNYLEDREKTSHCNAIVQGAMGRAPEDHSLVQWRNSDHYDESTQIVKAQDLKSTVEEGQFQNIEVYMAWDGVGSKVEKVLFPFFTGSTTDGNKDGKADGSGALFAVDRDGKLRSFNRDTGAVLQPNKWYKFNIVIHAGDTAAGSDDGRNWYKVYVDDKQVLDRTVFQPIARNLGGGKYDETITKFQGIYEYWFQVSGADNDKQSERVYFDDLTTTITRTEPTFTPATLTCDSEAAKLYQPEGVYGTVGYADSRMLEANWTPSEGTFQWAEGSLKANQAHNYGVMTKADGSKVYVDINTQASLIDPGGQASAMPWSFETEGKPTGWGDDNKFDNNNLGTTTTDYPAGLAGKDGEDKALRNSYSVNKAEQRQDSNSPLYIYFDSNNYQPDDWTTTPYTFAFSALAQGDFRIGTVYYISDEKTGGNGGWKDVVDFFPDGTIRSSGGTADANNVIGTYRKGEWVRFSIVTYPVANKQEIYINGNLAHTWETLYDLAAHPGAHPTRMKMEFNIDATSGPKEASLALDDIVLYQGARPEQQPVTLNSGNGYQVYDQGGVIFAPADASFSQDAISGTNAASQKLFADHTFAGENSGKLTEGNILAVKGTDGATYRYYYIAPGNPVKASALSVTNDQGEAVDFTPGAKGKAHINLNFFQPVNLSGVQAFIAQYDGQGNLVAADAATASANPAFVPGVQSDYRYPVTLGSWEVENLTVSDQAETVKLIVLESPESLTPLTLVKELK